MSAAALAAGAVAARRRARCSRRCCPGLVQHWKARLQGRRGPTPLQPYRELRRLWGKSAVDVDGHERRLPARAGGRRREPRRRRAARPGRRARARTRASATTCSRSPACSRSRASRVAAASWDVANGFSLMGASRDLTIVGVRRGDARARARGRRARRRHDRPARRWSPARPGTAVWSNPALALGAVAFALVVVAETGPAAGRQPRHAPRADDDPRGAAARVRGARPRATCSGRPRRGTGSCSCSPRRSSCRTRTSVWGQLALLPLALVVLCARARADRDAGREDADPARAAAARASAAVAALLGDRLAGWWQIA